MKTEIQMKEVLHSSSVKAIGYCCEFKELFVKFSSGVIYKYGCVQVGTYMDIVKLVVLGNMGTKSPVGKFIQDHIKGYYLFEKVIQPSNDYEFVMEADDGSM